jgi:ATP-dependent DNA helicase RecQ
MTTGADISLKEYLKKDFGFDHFRGNQEVIIRNVLNGNDTFVLMPTGGGKSLCYQLPSLLLDGTAIVISPLIALMKNQVDAMRGFSTNDFIAHHLNSSLSKTAVNAVKKNVLEGKTRLLYVAPESLIKEENVTFLKQANISFFAIDEAHCISEWGHDFRPVYRKIRPIIDEIGRVPIIALTATATPKVQHDIQKNLGVLDADVFKSSFNRSNLYYEVRPKINVQKEIIKYVKNNQGKSGIIYCLSRKKVEEIAEVLQINGIRALPYHAGLEANMRSTTQDKFLMEEIDVIVATIAFGMGIDKPDVRFVIHYDIPKSLEGYYQETGRAGRDGGEGNCVTFYSYKDIQKLEKFMQGKPVAEQEIGRQLLMETVSYAESSVCRRKFLLHYFGEDYHQHNCETCDNCLHPKKKFQGKEFLVDLFETIVAVNDKFKAEHIIDVLVGKGTPAVRSYKHDRLDIFGVGKDKEPRFWAAVIRQALVMKFLSKDIENYGLLSLSEEGKKFLNTPRDIMLSEDHHYEESDDDNTHQGMQHGAVDEELLAILKDMRKKMAKKLGLPPFVIFQDPSLEDMTVQYPVSIEELTHVSGVGTGKANRYGKEFCDVIARYVEEKEIIRPLDMVVKSVVKKSTNKVYFIQNIDRKLPLNDIAEAKGISMDELLKEIEAIVTAGTKLNLDYYINDVMDEEKIQNIYDYFKEDAESDSIEDALEEFSGEDYSEKEIRLVRLKFLSEVGN